MRLSGQAAVDLTHLEVVVRTEEGIEPALFGAAGDGEELLI